MTGYGIKEGDNRRSSSKRRAVKKSGQRWEAGTDRAESRISSAEHLPRVTLLLLSDRTLKNNASGSKRIIRRSWICRALEFGGLRLRVRHCSRDG